MPPRVARCFRSPAARWHTIVTRVLIIATTKSEWSTLGRFLNDWNRARKVETNMTDSAEKEVVARRVGKQDP